MASQKQRIAVAIELWPYRHHVGTAAGVLSYARQHTDWVTTVDPFGTDIRGRGYAGIIGRVRDDLAAAAKAAGVPIVNFWTGSPAADVPAVLPDYEAAGRLAAENLLSRGYRRFGFLGFLETQGSKRAQAGFCQRIRQAECPCLVAKVSLECDQEKRSWYRFLRKLDVWVRKFRPPVAVFVPHDTFCRRLAQVCLDAGLSIPEDVALIGLGNDAAPCLQPPPSLTSVDMDWERVGYEAAALLDRLLRGKMPPPGPVFIEPLGLVPRHSTDIYVVDDPLIGKALSFINSHAQETIGAAEVARHLYMTRRTLERRFVSALGHSVTAEIFRLRVERAKRLLLETDSPVKVVGADCGFTDIQQICRAFVKTEGITPAEYRRQHGK